MSDHPTAEDMSNKYQREAAYWRSRAEALEEALQDISARLLSAISLLERAGKAAKKVAPPDKMILDFKASAARAFAAALAQGGDHELP